MTLALSQSAHAHLAAGTAITTAGITGTFVFQHLNEIAMVVSVFATVIGVFIQAWVAIHNIRRKD